MLASIIPPCRLQWGLDDLAVTWPTQALLELVARVGAGEDEGEKIGSPQGLEVRCIS